MKLFELINEFKKLIVTCKEKRKAGALDINIDLISHLMFYQLDRLIATTYDLTTDITPDSVEGFLIACTKFRELIISGAVILESIPMHGLLSEIRTKIDKQLQLNGYPLIKETNASLSNPNPEIIGLQRDQVFIANMQKQAAYFFAGGFNAFDEKLILNFIMFLPDENLIKQAVLVFANLYRKEAAAKHLQQLAEQVNFEKLCTLFKLRKADFYHSSETLCQFFNDIFFPYWPRIKKFLDINTVEMTMRGDDLLFQMMSVISPSKWICFLNEFGISKEEVIGNTLQEQITKLSTIVLEQSRGASFVEIFELRSRVSANWSEFAMALNNIPFEKWYFVIQAFKLSKADLLFSLDQFISFILAIRADDRSSITNIFKISKGDFKFQTDELCQRLAKKSEQDRLDFLKLFAISKLDYAQPNLYRVLKMLDLNTLEIFLSLFQLQKTDLFTNDEELMGCLWALADAGCRSLFVAKLGIKESDYFSDLERCAQFLLSVADEAAIKKWPDVLSVFSKRLDQVFKTPTDWQAVFKHPNLQVEHWNTVFELSATHIKMIFPTAMERTFYFAEHLAKRNWQWALFHFGLAKENIFSQRDHLFAFLLNMRDRSGWNTFLHDFDLKVFTELMTENILTDGQPVTLIAKIKLEQITYFSCRPDRNRVIGYCLVVGYLKELKPASLTQSLDFYSYSPQNKKDAAEAFLAFLQSPHELTENDLDQFLKEQYATNSKLFKGALLNRTLGDIVKQIIPVAAVKSLFQSIGGYMSMPALTFSSGSSSSSKTASTTNQTQHLPPTPQ